MASKPVTPEEAEGLGLTRMVLVKDKAHPLAATLNAEYVSAFRRQYLTKACLEAVMVCSGCDPIVTLEKQLLSMIGKLV